MVENGPKIIAVCGKGGVGKTSISALITKVLIEANEHKKILAIDADPAVGFATALGVEVVRTVDDIRNELIERTSQGNRDDKLSILSQLDYEVFEAMIQKDRFAFLAIGRPEAEGCYCKVNTYLKKILAELAGHFDYVVIDGEAGIEQVNRRVMEKVTHLLLVSDSSAKGINVIKTIHEVASGGVMDYEQAGVILNRLKETQEHERVNLGGLHLLGCMLEDDMIRNFDIEGRTLLELPEGPSVALIRAALIKFGVI
ncbi:MAG TPA: AAA family ATPase [Syntrophomonas sp.]|nr:AAA family ATPase [Syntrophomonas sp.]